MAYSAASNLLTIVDANSNISNEYDDMNRVIAVTDNTFSPAKVITYTYYEDGPRASMTDPENNLTEYSYDAAKRLKELKYNSAIQAEYVYNALGLWTTVTSGAVANPAAVTTYTYNSQMWLSAMQHVIPATGAVISSYAYTYDYVGNRTNITLSNGDVITYTYDTLYQVTAMTQTGAGNTKTWTYDGVGNRLTNNGGSNTTYAYNDANQMISFTDTATTILQYDGNGNLITQTKGANTTVHTYDYENRLTNYNAPGTSNDAVYAYDALGRRISKNVNSGSTVEKYLYDGQNVVADYNNSNILQASYVTPFLDHNLIISRSGNTYYYLHDGLGSVRTIVDTSSTVQNSYDYNTYGGINSQTEGITNRYKFTGREYDTEASQYYYRGRHYKNGWARFLQRDPIGYLGGLNIYSYCGNNPVNYVDPMGLWSWGKIWSGIKTTVLGVLQVVGGAAVTQVDTPAPGPMDVIGAAIIVKGASDAAVGVAQIMEGMSTDDKDKAQIKDGIIPTIADAVAKEVDDPSTKKAITKSADLINDAIDTAAGGVMKLPKGLQDLKDIVEEIEDAEEIKKQMDDMLHEGEGGNGEDGGCGND